MYSQPYEWEGQKGRAMVQQTEHEVGPIGSILWGGGIGVKRGWWSRNYFRDWGKDERRVTMQWSGLVWEDGGWWVGGEHYGEGGGVGGLVE